MALEQGEVLLREIDVVDAVDALIPERLVVFALRLPFGVTSPWWCLPPMASMRRGCSSPPS